MAEWHRVGTLRRLVPTLLIPLTLSTVAALVGLWLLDGFVGPHGTNTTPGSTEQFVLLLTRGSAAPVAAGVATTLMIGAEFKDNTITRTLLDTPQRWRVLTAYLSVHTALAVLSALLCSGAILIVLAGGPGLSLPIPTLILALLLHAATTASWAVWGACLAVILAGPTLSLVALISWAVIGEPLVGNTIDAVIGAAHGQTAAILPFGALAAAHGSLVPEQPLIMATPASAVSPLIGAAVPVLSTAVLVVTAAVLLNRRRL